MATNLYALKEDDGKKHAPFYIPLDKAKELNANGYGIFFAVHEMDSTKRSGANLKKIRAWFVDIDYGEKDAMLFSLMNAPLEPSLIIETKRGYHSYWLADDTATKENFKEIEQNLINEYGGDEQVKDFARIMRLPGYYHNKDKNNKFLVRIVHHNNKKYKEEKMLLAFSRYQKKRKISYINKDISLRDFKDETSIIKFFKVPPLDQDSGRHGFIMTKIGYMKHLGFNDSERETCVRLINQNFKVALPEREIESILRTT